MGIDRSVDMALGGGAEVGESGVKAFCCPQAILEEITLCEFETISNPSSETRTPSNIPSEMTRCEVDTQHDEPHQPPSGGSSGYQHCWEGLSSIVTALLPKFRAARTKKIELRAPLLVA